MKFRLKMKELKRSQRGFTLIEVILAIALLGIIAVAFLSAMGTGSLSLFIADERATAESLARSQLEYVKNQDYEDAPDGGEAVYTKINLDGYDGYIIRSYDRAGITDEVVGVPWNTETDEPSDTDNEIIIAEPLSP